MFVTHHFFRSLFIVASLSLVAVSLGSCQAAKNQATFDRSAEKDRQDYRDALSPRPVPGEEVSDIPDFQSIVATPEDLKLPSPLVTVSVNNTVSLRDLMFELAEQSGVDIELDPQIRGSLIFTAKERPFNEVVARITEMAGLRYTFQNNILRVELDRPYIKNYRVDYMNVTRKSESSIDTTVETASAGDDGGSSGGSEASIDNTFDGDFWKDLDEGLKQILTASDTYLSLATLADPIARVDPPPAAAPIIDPNNPQAAVVPPPLPQQPPTLSVSSSSEPLIPNPPATYSISKQAGVVSVFASERQHKLVQKFFEQLKNIALTQIQIEARILEVSLKDEFATGINWGDFDLTGMLRVESGASGFARPAFSPANATAFTLRLNTNDVSPVIDALSRFGTVRALSSPRITVLNNQPAVINVSENQVFFTIETTTTVGDVGGPVTSSDSTQDSVPVGVLMNVIPTANAETGEIILAVRPTITKKTGDIEDPCPACNGIVLATPNTIPQLSVQEIDSIIRMQSGQTMIMGGLMQDQNNVTQVGVPVIGDIPYIGGLFRSHSDVVTKQELVILITARILPGGNSDEMDRKIYQKFSNDRRPVRL